MTVPKAAVLVTEYLVSAVPIEDGDSRHFALYVQWRGGDRWCVADAQNGATGVLNAAGEWEWEPQPSERREDFLARTRFDMGTALEMARAAAPKVTVNGYTVEDGIRMQAARKARRAARETV